MRPCGALLLDKPAGLTSHDVVAAIRRASGERRVGHAGTLDPIATGLLILALGSATRILEYLVGHDKRYLVHARLGVETATYDSEGEVVAAHQGPLPEDRDIEAALPSFTGDIEQTPPAYSAVKVGGKPLYWHARRGDAPQVSPRRVTVYSLAWERPSPDLLALQVHCSSGTYVRSLVHDLGRRLGCGAHVIALRRLASGPFTVADALSLEEAEARLRARDWSALIGIRQALAGMPVIELSDEAAARLRLGQAAAADPPSATGDHLALDEGERPVGMVRWTADEAMWRPRKVFSGCAGAGAATEAGGAGPHATEGGCCGRG